jgi:hypothetical protein
MSMQQCPTLVAIVVKQRQQELRREATQMHAAKIANSANKASNGRPWIQLKAVAARVHSRSAHRVSGAVRWVEFRLSAQHETPVEAWSE